MQRFHARLSQSQRSQLAAQARWRDTTFSALIREALDEYLTRQAQADFRVLRRRAFGGWAPDASAPTIEQLRREERLVDQPSGDGRAQRRAIAWKKLTSIARER